MKPWVPARKTWRLKPRSSRPISTDATKLAEKYEADAKEAPKLREQVAKLEQGLTKMQQELDEKTKIAEMGDEKKAAEVFRRLNLFTLRRLLLRTLERALGLGCRLSLHPTAPGTRLRATRHRTSAASHRLGKGSQFMDRRIFPTSAVLVLAAIVVATWSGRSRSRIACPAAGPRSLQGRRASRP